MPSGIVACFLSWEEGFCWEKTTEFSLDILFLGLTIFQLVLHCLREFSLRSIKYWLYILMFLTLLTNLLHQVFFHVYSLFYLSTFFFNNYFVTLLYYAGYNMVQRWSYNKVQSIRTLQIVYIGVFLLHVVLLIQSFFSNDTRCIYIWYLIVRTVGFVLSIGLCVIGRVHVNRANAKLKQLGLGQAVHNPVPKLWCWIWINIISQLINLVRTFIFAFVNSLDCKYDKNNVEINYSLELLMLLLTFYMPMASTIYIFWMWMRPKLVEGRDSFESDMGDVTPGVQLIVVPTRTTSPSNDY